MLIQILHCKKKKRKCMDKNRDCLCKIPSDVIKVYVHLNYRRIKTHKSRFNLPEIQILFHVKMMKKANVIVNGLEIKTGRCRSNLE